MAQRKLSPEEVGRKHGFRSGLEDAIGDQLAAASVAYEYEAWIIEYRVPAKEAKYTPDFFLPNGIIIESKGRFITADRQKMRLIKDQFPDLDIRFVFSSSRAKINKGSRTTYGMWAEKHGFPYADRFVPKQWIEEAPNEVSLAAIQQLRRR